MAPVQMKRNCDPGVSTAVSSIVQHQNFKRMLMFGLRSLSDYCNPTSKLYKENAFDAMNRNAITPIKNAVAAYKDDEDILFCSSRILWAMTEYCCKERDQNALQKFVSDGGVAATVDIINSAPSEEETVKNCMLLIENMNSSTVQIEGGDLGIGLLKIFTTHSYKHKMQREIVGALAVAAKSSSGAKALNDEDAQSKLLEHCIAFQTINDDVASIVEMVFETIKNMASNGYVNPNLIEQCVLILDKFSSYSKVVAKGSEAMKYAVGPEQLQSCLKVLKSADPKSEEHEKALELLSSLSYVSSITDEVVKAGGIPVLIELINSGLQQYESNPEKISRVIAGTCRMLGRISSTPANAAIVDEYGGIASLCTALSYCPENVDCACSICRALIPFVSRSDYASEIMNYSLFASLFPILYGAVESIELAKASMECIAAATLIHEFHENMVSNQAIEILSTCIQYHVTETDYLLNCISAYFRLSDYITSVEVINQYGGVSGIADALTAQSNNHKIAENGLKMINKMLTASDAMSYLSNKHVVDAVLTVMLQNEEDEVIIQEGTKIMEKLATEEDCVRHISNLESVISNARNNSATTYNSLAAICGLSRIPALRYIMQSKKADQSIYNGIKIWLESPRFEDQSKLIKAGLKTIKVLRMNAGTGVHEVIHSLVEVISIPQARKVIESDEPDDNVLITTASCIYHLTKANKIDSAADIDIALDSIFRLMKKYSESRRTQVICLEAINNIIVGSDAVGAEVFVNKGYIKTVVTYLQKVPMYADAQIAGFTLLYTLVKIRPENIEPIRKNNTLVPLQTAVRTHAKNVELKNACTPLLALLMPLDALIQQVEELVKACDAAIDAHDLPRLHGSLCTLNELILTPEASKIAARCQVGNHLVSYVDWLKANPKCGDKVTLDQYDITGRSLYDATVSEIARTHGCIAQTRIGLVHLTKAGAANALISAYDILILPGDNYTEEAVTNILEALSMLMKHDIVNSDIAFNNGLVKKLCLGIQHFSESDTVIKSTCGCLAGMCTSDKKVQQLISQPEYKELVAQISRLIGNQEMNVTSRTNAMKALHELLKTYRAEIVVDIAQNTSAVDNLIQIMEEYDYEVAVVREAAECLAIIAEFLYLEEVMNTDKYSAIRSVLNVLSKNKNDETAALHLMNVLVKLCNNNDKNMLKELGAIDIVSDVMMIHSENDEIAKLGGVLFSYMGADEQVKTLMKLILSTNKDDPDSIRKIVNLTGKLEMFLRAPLENPPDALQYTEATLQVLNEYLNKDLENPQLQANVALVTKRLVDRAREDPEDQLGAWAVASAGTLNQYVDMINHNVGDSNVAFLAPLYNVLDGCVLNPYTKQMVVDQLPQLLIRTNELLDMHKDKPAVVQSIFEFLQQLAADPETAKALYAYDAEHQDNLVQKALDAMNMHRANDQAVVSGFKLLGALALNANESGHVSEMEDPAAILQICEQLLSVSPSKERTVAFMQLVDSMILANLLDEKTATDVLKKIDDMMSEENLSKYPESDRNEINLAYATLIKDCADTGLFAHIRPAEKSVILNNLGKISETSEDPKVHTTVMEALSSIAACDSAVSSKLGANVLPLILEGDHDMILNDTEAQEAFLQLLENLVTHEGVGRQLLNNEDLNKLLDELEQSIENRREELGDEYVDLTKTRISNIRVAMEDDKPKEKTCKVVYDMLTELVASESPINVLNDSTLDEDMNFVLDRLSVYMKDSLLPTSLAGIDFSYGNMACETFCEDVDNVAELADRSFHTSAFHALINQPNENVKHYSCRALCAFTKVPKGLESIKEIKDFPNIISTSVGNLANEKTIDNESREEFLKTRVLLIDRTAFNRNVYDKTKAVTYLINIWNDYDKGMYSIQLLRHVFRAMRKIVSDAHVQTLLNANVLFRLIEIINDEHKDKVILPDVLFLLGSLSIVRDIKTKIGELKGVEACVNLLLRSLHVEKMEPTITNACLALANMCIDHKPNCGNFFNLRGPDLNVRILREYRSNFDVTNGASVLLCNVLFKNEQMKKYYGTNGAPLELVECLKSYDGSDQKNAVRCLESLFKAISNLSLYTSNVQYFLDAQIEVSYESWLNKLNESFPDAQLETGLRTLSNLVMENEERNMRNFGVALIPVLNVLKQGRDDTKVVYLMLDVLSSLCRLSDNAVVLAENGGIDTVIETIQKFDYDVGILTLAIHLIGTQSKIESSMPLLMSANVFGILISCIEVDPEEPEMVELVVSALRCARRLIQSEELAYEFCNCGGIATVANVICKSAAHAIIMLEVLRVLMCVLYHTQNVEGVTNEYTEEDELHTALLGGWYNVSMDKDMIEAIIQAVLTCANDEQHQKQLRLQKIVLGFLAYCAYHGLCIVSMTASGFDVICRECLVNFAGDPVILQLLAICIDNIALYSSEIYDTTVSREIIKAFKTALSKIPKGKEEKAIQQKLTLTLNAMNSSDDPLNSFKDTLQIFDFNLSEFDVDPYMNGVHDLPSNVKDSLRKGGMFKIFYNSDERQAFRWKSTQDLNAIEWTVGENLENVFKVPIVRIRNISKGLVHPLLVAANKREPRKITPKVTLCIFGPSTEEFPQGLEMPIKTKTQKERDAFVDLIVMWRDAASYNY